MATLGNKWNYGHADKRKRRSSTAWEHFRQTSRTVVVCALCEVEMAFHGSTTAMQQHLKRKHPEVNSQGDNQTAPKKQCSHRVEDCLHEKKRKMRLKNKNAFYSSGIYCQNTPEYDDLFGFSAEDVRQECRRGNKLFCHKCRRRGATVGCEVRSCRRSYHYPCAIEDGASTADNYGLHCILHQKCTPEQAGSSETLGGARSTALSDKKIRKQVKSEETPSKHLRRISDDSSDSDMDLYGPLESDLEEQTPETLHQSSRKHSVSPSHSPSGNGSEELSGRKREEEFDVKPSPSEDATTLPGPHFAEDPDEVKPERKKRRKDEDVHNIDPARFWKGCNAAGCTKAIFKDFLDEMNVIGCRIQSDIASEEDYRQALAVMQASGKLEELVDKQQQELRRKLEALSESMSALEEVVSTLKN